MEAKDSEEKHDSFAGSNSEAEVSSASSNDKPIVILVIGMAGSGKTTLMQRMAAYLNDAGTPAYILNCDPAVTNVPYGANIDIRDTVNYKNVMKQYNLGPNGGILTSLNLFATRFDQVIQLCEKKRTPQPKYILVDTPGQIEIFTWSASGAIITEAFASTFPTMIAYVVDTARSAAPQTFMSNMLQACSILYKTKLPLLLAFNKIDVVRHEFAIDWMKDYEKFDEALQHDTTYAATLSRSLSLVLEEFYDNLKNVGVSAATGEGMDAFFERVQECAEEYKQLYLPELRRRQQERDQLELKRQQANMEQLRLDTEDPAGEQGC